jgi:hypothetical protein
MWNLDKRIERLQVKWLPVRAGKTRENKNMERFQARHGDRFASRKRDKTET